MRETFIFIDTNSKSTFNVYTDQLEANLKPNNHQPVDFTKDELWKKWYDYCKTLEKQDVKVKSKVVKDIINIENLYPKSNIIIGGGSNFVESVNTDLLRDQIVIGCNEFPTHYPSTWGIVIDSMATKESLIPELFDIEGLKLAYNDEHKLGKELRLKADLLFKRSSNREITSLYKGTLLDSTGIASSALHLACLMGATNILLLGVDFTEKYNSKWNRSTDLFTKPDNYISEMYKDTQLLKALFDVNIYQANPKAKTKGLSTLSLEEFIEL